MNDCENSFIREAIEEHKEVIIYFKNANYPVRGVIVNEDAKTIKIKVRVDCSACTHNLIYKDSIQRIEERY